MIDDPGCPSTPAHGLAPLARRCPLGTVGGPGYWHADGTHEQA
jgi:hypothetical protein